MKRIYFEIDNPEPLVAWLKQRPAGSWDVLLGSDDEPDDGSDRWRRSQLSPLGFAKIAGRTNADPGQ